MFDWYCNCFPLLIQSINKKATHRAKHFILSFDKSRVYVCRNSLLNLFKVESKAKIMIRYNQVSYLNWSAIMESEKIKDNTTHSRAEACRWPQGFKKPGLKKQTRKHDKDKYQT